MESRAIRVPAETYESARHLGGLLQKTPGRILEVALQEYLATHKEEITEAFEHAKKFLASGDRARLVSLAAAGNRDMARAAVQRLREED